jgi:hypothetical protein
MGTVSLTPGKLWMPNLRTSLSTTRLSPSRLATVPAASVGHDDCQAHKAARADAHGGPPTSIDEMDRRLDAERVFPASTSAASMRSPGPAPTAPSPPRMTCQHLSSGSRPGDLEPSERN